MAAPGRIGRTIRESEPSFAPVAEAAGGRAERRGHRARRPRLRAARLLRLDIATPPSTRSPRGGLRYNRFHVTALCSPTARVPADRPQPPRGRHGLPHRHPDRVPRLQRPHPEIGRHAGRASSATRATARFAVGKWHLAPRWEQSASGPFDRWPLGLGFERYYGFLGGDTNQWTPELVRDNHFVEPPRGPADGLPPHRGPRRPRHPVRAGPAAGDAGQAVLPVLRDRRDARAAPGAAQSGSTATAAASTTAGRRGEPTRSPASASSASCPRAPPCRPPELGARLGLAVRTTSAGSSPARWRCSRAS